MRELDYRPNILARSLVTSRTHRIGVLRGDWTSRSGYQLGPELVDRRDVTAVLVANDQMALGVLRACHDSGIVVPADLSVIGFDDIPKAEFFTPGLTTVRQNFDAIGRRGLEQLLTLMEGGASRRRVVLIKPELIERASTAAPHAHGRRTRTSAAR